VMSPSREFRIAHARQECFRRLYELKGTGGGRAFSTSRIGAMFKSVTERDGGLDHTTVIWGIRKAKERFAAGGFGGAKAQSLGDDPATTAGEAAGVGKARAA